MSFESIGALLKRLRLAHGLSALELSRAVHIREQYILALEAGDMANLPGTAYSRAYIERLLIFLEHDPAEALAAFDAASEEPSRKLFQLSMRWGASPHPTPTFALATSLAALVLLLGWNMVLRAPAARLIDTPTATETAPTTTDPTFCKQGESTLPCFWQALPYKEN